MTSKIDLVQVLNAYDYANNHPHKYLRGTTNWCAAVAHSLNEQAASEAPRQELVAWEVYWADNGEYYFTTRKKERSGKLIADPDFKVVPLYAAPLSPDHSGGGAGMVLTDDQILEAMREHIYAADGGYVFDTAKDDVIAAGRALLDKFKELNQ